MAPSLLELFELFQKVLPWHLPESLLFIYAYFQNFLECVIPAICTLLFHVKSESLSRVRVLHTDGISLIFSLHVWNFRIGQNTWAFNDYRFSPRD